MGDSFSFSHASLDRAVWAAYGWPEPPEETDDEKILARLLALNLERATDDAPCRPVGERRPERGPGNRVAATDGC